MFRKDGKAKSANPNLTDTLIGEKTFQEGVIVSQASLRVEGKVTGEIDCKGDLLVGKKGEVVANVKARNIYNSGLIKGTIQANGLLTITSSGRVVGDIDVKSLNIAEGGIFQGTSMMKMIAEHLPQDTKTSQEHESTSSKDDQNVLHKLESLQKQDSRKQEKSKAASGH